MRCRRKAGMGFLTIFLLIGACGEEVAEQQAVVNEPPEKPACDLIRPVDLQQIFVNPLAADTESPSSTRQCTWIDPVTKEPFLRYELHPYSEDLQTRVDSIEQELGKGINARFVQGIGDSAAWTDVGLFANRNGRTLQVEPLREGDDNHAPYQELARLLLTRLEGS